MIYLVRHAHSDYSPDEMRPLSVAGQEAAGRVADALQASGITRIVSSPYRRAVQTVEPLAARLSIPVEIDADLRERRLSNVPLDDFLRCLAATWQDFELTYPGGEASREAQIRVSAAIRRIAAESGDQNVAVASHGNAVALFLQTLDPAVDFAFWRQMSLPDIYAVELRRADAWCFSRIGLRS
jgi:2,3-bisphosphoglycerate-dependent phosphoglycerate mutase